MTAKEFLQRGWKVDLEIRELLQAKEEAFARALHAGGGDGERVQQSVDNHQESRNVEYANYSLHIDRKIDELCAIKDEILGIIMQVEDTELRALLIARYINLKRWETIANDFGYCWSQVMRLRSKGLRAVQEKLRPNGIE